MLKKFWCVKWNLSYSCEPPTAAQLNSEGRTHWPCHPVNRSFSRISWAAPMAAHCESVILATFQPLIEPVCWSSPINLSLRTSTAPATILPKLNVSRSSALPSCSAKSCYALIAHPLPLAERWPFCSLSASKVRRFMASVSSPLSLKHGLSLWCPRSGSLDRVPLQPSSVGFRSFRRSYVAASSAFANDNREWVCSPLNCLWAFASSESDHSFNRSNKLL